MDPPVEDELNLELCKTKDDPVNRPEDYEKTRTIIETADIVRDYKATKRAVRIAKAESKKEALWKEEQEYQKAVNDSFNEMCDAEQARIRRNFEELKNAPLENYDPVILDDSFEDTE